ncbi:MAG: hypothetical protein HS107_01595 [Thermoflexaceae bacterium]|nr:hypothetical protein [Thermoflexaceae bacterium]
MNRFTLGRFAVGAGILAVAVGIGIATAYLVGRNTAAEASPVEVRQGDTVVQSQSESDALREASQRAGFEVKGLGFLHDPDLKLKNINIDLGPEGAENAVASVILLYAKFDPSGRRTGFVGLSQVNVRPDHPANWQPDSVPNRPLDLKIPGVEAWASATGARTTYTVFWPGRAFYVVVEDPQPGDSQLQRMLASLGTPGK